MARQDGSRGVEIGVSASPGGGKIDFVGSGIRLAQPIAICSYGPTPKEFQISK